ncbi:MAG: AMP-binding protein, partial [Promethearchaeota archaeon]
MIEVPELTFFWQYPEYWAEKEPNLAAISFKKKVITAKELNDQTDQLGKAFINLGVKKGDTIVTILPTNPEFILTYIAASKIGAITIPMDIKYKKADFELLIPQSSP